MIHLFETLTARDCSSFFNGKINFLPRVLEENSSKYLCIRKTPPDVLGNYKNATRKWYALAELEGATLSRF